jgi:hypothetical protein
MTSYQLLSAVLAAVVIGLLWANYRRWISFTCVGVFTMFFLLMNYTGVMLTIWGYEWQTIFRMPDLTPYMSDAQLCEAVLIVNVGVLAVWAGILSFERLYGAPRLCGNRCVMNIDSETPIGMKPWVLLLLGVLFSIAFWLAFRRLAGGFFSVAGVASAAEQWEYRMDATRDRTHYLVMMIGYNVLPYLAMCGLVLFWKTRQFIYLALVPLALLGKFVFLHKEPLVVFLLHAGIVWTILQASVSHSGKKFPWLKIAAVCVLVFAVLPFLYVFLRDYDLTAETLYHQSIGSLERIVGRMSNTYFFFAYFIPERYDFHGLGFVRTISDFVGLSHVAINKEIFYDLQGGNIDYGSIASDNLVNLYGGFGFTGLAIGGFLQGVLLAAVDRWFSRVRTTLGWFVLYSFLVIILGITLNQAHIFGVMLGYGGIPFMVLALLINVRQAESRATAAVERPAGGRDRPPAAAIATPTRGTST